MTELDPLVHQRLAQNPHKQPMGIRFLLWVAVGKALGIPVDDLFESINTQLRAAKRERGKGKAPYTDRERMRLAELAKRLGTVFNHLFQWVVSPAAMVRWLKRHQERLAQNYRPPDDPGRGRPPVSQEKIDAVLRIYRKGLMGLKRIQGECKKCGIDIARSTIRKILDKHGLHPGDNATPGRHTWRTFWRNHAAETIGIDFMQVAVGLFGNISYHFVLVAIEHDTRKAHLLGITEHPTDPWLRNVVINSLAEGEQLAGHRYWVHDNDGKFQTLDGILANCDKKSVRTAIMAPDMNAFSERFIRSAKEECLDHIVFMSENHLQSAVKTYIEHYNTVRPHQGIGNVTIGPWQAEAEGRIVCDEELGGLLKSFRRAA